MVKDTLIEKHVSTKQCEKAIGALLKYTQKRRAQEDESTLFQDEEQAVWLVIALKQMQPNAHKLKPYRIPLAHSIVDPRTTPICLITKDPQRKYKDLLQEKNIKFISRVVGITKLKGKFKPFEPRRQLMSEHGLFLADRSVVPLLPGLLGKIFFKAKKQPVPVNLEHTDLKAHLESAVSSTYLHLNAGTCTSVKIGITNMPAGKLLQNLQTALPEIIKRLAPTTRKRTEGGEEAEDPWANIQSLMIKTSESASLPVWSCQLGASGGGRWEGLLGEQAEMEIDEEAEFTGIAAKGKAVKPVLAKPSDTPKGKGKKRTAEESEGEPKKKKKKKSVETDGLTSTMKGLTVEKAMTEVKAAATNAPTSASIKIKATSSTSASSKPAPTTESANKPKKISGGEVSPRKAEVSPPSATKPPAEKKSGPATADKPGKKGKTKPATIEAREPAKAEKPKREKKKDGDKEKEPTLILKPKSTDPALKARENDAKPLKSAVKSFSLSDGIREKKKISFDLKSGKEGKRKKTGGRLSSKERLVGRGPRNA